MFGLNYVRRKQLYKPRKHLKSVSLNDYSPATNVVYINENFTYSRRKFFAKVRKLRIIIIGIVPGLWTARYLLRTGRTQPKIIHAEGDLNRIS